jgi:hypothetical protein
MCWQQLIRLVSDGLSTDYAMQLVGERKPDLQPSCISFSVPSIYLGCFFVSIVYYWELLMRHTQVPIDNSHGVHGKTKLGLTSLILTVAKCQLDKLPLP